MTVRELIEELRCCSPDAEVTFWTGWSDYTVDSVREEDGVVELR